MLIGVYIEWYQGALFVTATGGIQSRAESHYMKSWHAYMESSSVTEPGQIQVNSYLHKRTPSPPLPRLQDPGKYVLISH
jgi:hypothetical protein